MKLRFLRWVAMLMFLIACVIGTGSTYQEAYRDAVNRLPPGAHYKSVSVKKVGTIFYVRLYY